jgi:hypothetical protein
LYFAGKNLWKNGIYGQFREDAWEEPEAGVEANGEPEFPLPVVPDPRLIGVQGQFNNMGFGEDPQEIYDKLPRSDDIFNLKFSDLDLRNELG